MSSDWQKAWAALYDDKTIDEQPTMEQALENKSAERDYYELHAACPSCGRDDRMEQTCMG